jgi:hypothetical protein
MTPTNHLVPPPLELVEEWKRTAPHPINEREHYHYITLCAAQWGADQELEACCEWFSADVVSEVIDVVSELRSTRRPQPPNLKEQALGALGRFNTNTHTRADEMTQDFDLIRRALEALDD